MKNRIQNKGLSFIPGKGSSPINASLKQNQQCNLTNMNHGGANTDPNNHSNLS